MRTITTGRGVTLTTVSQQEAVEAWLTVARKPTPKKAAASRADAARAAARPRGTGLLAELRTERATSTRPEGTGLLRERPIQGHWFQ